MIITKNDFIAFLDAPRHLWAIKHSKLSEQEINVLFNVNWKDAESNPFIDQNKLQHLLSLEGIPVNE